MSPCPETHALSFRETAGFWRNLRPLVALALGGGITALTGGLFAHEVSGSFLQRAMALRAEAIRKATPSVILVPVAAGSPGFSAAGGSGVAGRYGWKSQISTTIFWIGEQPTPQNPVSNEQSAWDRGWTDRYGGYDDPSPAARRNFAPVSFLPRLNPFYVALPYNDIDDHHTKPEASRLIPWFKSAFVRDGQSVCQGRWVAIRHGNRVCYAQWADVGPFATDDWQYVFGNGRPHPNPNQNAGLDVSPAVREYLGLNGIDQCDWKFVDFSTIPSGPWAWYGENNPFVRLHNVRSGATAKRVAIVPGTDPGHL